MAGCHPEAHPHCGSGTCVLASSRGHASAGLLDSESSGSPRTAPPRGDKACEFSRPDPAARLVVWPLPQPLRGQLDLVNRDSRVRRFVSARLCPPVRGLLAVAGLAESMRPSLHSRPAVSIRSAAEAMMLEFRVRGSQRLQRSLELSPINISSCSGESYFGGVLARAPLR